MHTNHIHYRKILSLSLFLSGFVSLSSAQQLLETSEGDPLYYPVLSTDLNAQNDVGLIKLNTGDQSLGVNYFHNFRKDVSDSKYTFIQAGIKAKPTEGYATVFKNGQFSPGVEGTFNINVFKLFDLEQTKSNNWTDWGGVYIKGGVNKYSLYRSDTIFKNQLYSKVLIAPEIGINYNRMWNSKWLASFKLGVSRKSNYSDLNEFTVEDTKSEFDTISSTLRTVRTSKIARLGSEYKEFDALTMRLAVTKLTADNDSQRRYQLGWSIYLDVKGSSIAKPRTNAGAVIYLAQVKNSISAPILGLDFNLADLANVGDSKSSVFKRISFGLTSVFSIR